MYFLGMSTSRAEVVDFTWPTVFDSLRIIAGRGRPQADPWAFLLPLTTLVWVASLAALVLLSCTVYLTSLCRPLKAYGQDSWTVGFHPLVRVLLQQGNNQYQCHSVSCVTENYTWLEVV